MKQTLVVSFILFYSIVSSAQKHNIWADIGYVPGASVTYNYKFAKRFAAGAGLQGYTYYRTDVDGRKFTPALFADLRLNLAPGRKNQFFSLLDLGMNIYKQDKTYFRDTTSVYNIPHNNGFYSGLGIGYFRRITKRNSGIYASFKLMLNWHTLTRYSIISEEEDIELLSANGAAVFSIGFKF